jgi:hypothetical protein
MLTTGDLCDRASVVVAVTSVVDASGMSTHEANGEERYMHALRNACTHARMRACMQDNVPCVVKTTGSVGLGVGVEEDAT